jgi:hypothetical protein
MRSSSLWLLLAALCALAGLTAVTASDTPVVCHYSTQVNLAIQQHVAAVNGAFLDPPPSAFTYAYDVGAAYTNIVYQQDLHICAAKTCPASFPSRVAGTLTASIGDYAVDSQQSFSYFVHASGSYTLETAPIPAYSYTLYAHEPLPSTEQCGDAVANLSMCCLYQVFGVVYSYDSELWEINNDYGLQVTRLEHPSRPGGCISHYSNPLESLQAVLLASYPVASSTHCVAVEQLPWNDPVVVF